MGAVMKMIMQIIFLCVGIILLHAIPTWLHNAINVLPQPLPTVIGAFMALLVGVGLIAVINKLMKGNN
jgi:hypothetical protein